MSTEPSIETSRPQLVAVVLALGLATLTCLLPLSLGMVGITGLLAFAAGAKTLQSIHGLEPGSFGAGFYLATLLLLGAGGWQVTHSVKAWLARRAQRKLELAAGAASAQALAKPQGLPASLLNRPWMLLGVALWLIDLSLVRWEIRGRLDSPDGLLAAAVLATMAWATVFIAVMSVRLTGQLWRTLLRSTRRSPYMAGLVTAFSLALSVASVVGIQHYGGETSDAVAQQNVVTSIEEAPAASSSLEELRLALVEYAEPKKTAESQPLIKDEVPRAVAALPPAAVPADPLAVVDPLVEDILGDAPAGTAGRLPPVRAAENAPVALPPVVVPAAAAESADADAPFLGLSFGPASASCVDRLTERKLDGDPIQNHSSRIARNFGISEHDARALVIETLVSVCMKKADDREDLSRYFSRSITNAARNFVSRHLNGQRVCSIELVPVVDFPDETESWHFADETEQRAQGAFCKLSELDQAIIQARVMHDLKFSQIGEMTGLTESGASKAFDRALRRLRKNFEKS